MGAAGLVDADAEGAATVCPVPAANASRAGSVEKATFRPKTSPVVRLRWLEQASMPILPWRRSMTERALMFGASARRQPIVMISITTLAADKVKEISKSEGLEGQGLRLRVVGGGCAGFQYDLYFEDKPTDLDEQFESHGVKLFVDPLSYQYLDGTEIDYVEGAHGSGFKFGNPNVSGTCGCGSSFQA
jgi:iron-sulfur cluster insertion protein